MVENIVDYQAVLADLQARKAGLEALITGLEAHVLGQAAVEVITDGKPGVASPSIPGSVAAIHPDTFFGLSIIEASKKFLKMAGRAQHTTTIADTLARGGLKRPDDGVLSSILVRAAKGREVTKVGKAMWGLPEWYPKAPKNDNGEATRKVTKPNRKRGRPAGKKPQTATTAAAKKSPEATTASAAKTPTGNGTGLLVAPLIMDILRSEAGKPVHAKEVTSRVNGRGNAAPRTTVEAQLNRWVKKGKVKKTGPSMYAL